MHQSVRVRFAPSPTGPLHIGGLRTALYNYLYARQHKGVFVLRIEDTDQSRFVPGAGRYIQESLEWCGLTPDEGPEQGGAYGPYRQSERADLYKKHIDALIKKEKAYYAFDLPESLEQHRKDHESRGKTFVYNWHNRNKMQNSISLDEEETKKRIADGEPYVVRFKMYQPGLEKETFKVHDQIRGEIESDLQLLDDKILFKSDGMPTYHFANVVDDHLMEISHVIRGEEWLPSLPLHIRLYDALAWQPPVFAHLPLILKPTGKGKLSKRDGEKLGFPVFPLAWKKTESTGYREQGFLPEAVINFLALLGWNPGTEEELFDLQSLVASFDLSRVHKAGARFDPEKNRWFNQQHIQRLPDSKWIKECEKVLAEKKGSYDKKTLSDAAALIQNRVVVTKDIWEELKVFFEGPTAYDEKAVKKAWKEQSASILLKVCEGLKEKPNSDSDQTKQMLVSIANQHQTGLGAVMAPLRVCLVGSLKGPDLMKLVALIGTAETTSRILQAIEVLQK